MILRTVISRCLTSVVPLSSLSKPNVMGDTKSSLAVVKKLEGGKITFSFRIDNPVGRQVNMCRNGNESMASFNARLEQSIVKAVVKGKKSTQDLQKPSFCFLRNGEEIQAETPSELFDESGLIFSLFGKTYEVRVNPPLVESVKIPDTILTGFMVYPSKLQCLYADKEETGFQWLVSDSSGWILRGEAFVWIPNEEDRHRHVKLICTPRSKGKSGLAFEIVSKNPVTSGPKRPRKACPANVDPWGFRILTYNLLADLYADSDFSRTVLFPQCPHQALKMSYRKLLFLDELIGYRSDVLCLQEVDEKIFKHDLLPVLSRRGFDGSFSLKSGKVSEGLACFWNLDKFRLVRTERFVLAETLNESLSRAVNGNPKLKETFAKRPNVLKVVVLESLTCPERRLVVGITHLYFKPDADHVRLLQVAACMDHLQRILKTSRSETGVKHSLILAGDFNSTPDFGVMEFMRKGTISETHPDWSSCSEEAVKDLTLSHDFQMDSACGAPEFTTYTVGFKDCIDYIFYETGDLEVTNVLPFPSKAELDEHQALPNISFPSDHLACVADLSWTQSD